MTITTVDQLSKSFNSKYQDIIISKASLANTASGQYVSLWTSTGLPSAGGAPGTTPIVPSNSTTGAFPIRNAVLPEKNYMCEFQFSVSNGFTTVELHDKLLVVSGLSGTVTTPQTVTGMDMSSFLATSNLDQRKGSADYSDVQWWVEWYAQTGTTVTPTLTVNVTYNDDSTGNLTAFQLTPQGRVGRMIPLNGLIPEVDQGKYIRGINSGTLSGTTGTAGNFGFTATRYRCAALGRLQNTRYSRTWDEIGMPEIFEDSALFPIVMPSGTSTGIIQINAKMVTG